MYYAHRWYGKLSGSEITKSSLYNKITHDKNSWMLIYKTNFSSQMTVFKTQCQHHQHWQPYCKHQIELMRIVRIRCLNRRPWTNLHSSPERSRIMSWCLRLYKKDVMPRLAASSPSRKPIVAPVLLSLRKLKLVQPNIISNQLNELWRNETLFWRQPR